MRNIPLALYIHIPWCVRKCPYCDFNSHASTDELNERGYIKALLADLDHELSHLPEREVESVFIGGGTPSLFSCVAITRLLEGIRDRLPLVDGAEVTLEANPGTLEAGRYQGYRQAGVSRLSIGVQSFDHEMLRRLGRIHGPDEAMEAIAVARSVGFDELNIDLMFGLPGQSLEMAEKDVTRAVTLNPSHISYYQLTLESNTAFYHAPPALPDEDLLMDIQLQGQQQLADAGYMQYEVSAYAREGHHCRHNLNYWQFGDYLGIGAGAHGKLSEPGSGVVTRRWRVKHPQAYLQHAGSGEAVAGSHRLDRNELLGEFMLNALRLNQGFSRALFEHRTGLPLDLAGESIERAIARGLLERNGDDYRATSLGGRFLDDLVAMFFVSEEL